MSRHVFLPNGTFEAVAAERERQESIRQAQIANRQPQTPAQRKAFCMQQIPQLKRGLAEHLRNTTFVSGMEYDKRTTAMERRIAELEEELRSLANVKSEQEVREDSQRATQRAQTEARETRQAAYEAERQAEEDKYMACPKCSERILRTQLRHSLRDGEVCYPNPDKAFRCGLLTRDMAYGITGDPKYL